MNIWWCDFKSIRVCVYAWGLFTFETYFWERGGLDEQVEYWMKTKNGQHRQKRWPLLRSIGYRSLELL
jgi:hypothetical protein